MTRPETIVPASPDNKIIISAILIATICDPNAEKDTLGAVKYSNKVLSPVINNIINGYNIAITHVPLSNIVKIKDIPKKITKYSNIETINCTNSINVMTPLI